MEFMSVAMSTLSAALTFGGLAVTALSSTKAQWA